MLQGATSKMLDTLFPPFESQGPKGNTYSTLKGRFSANWRMIPSFSLLIISVGGVVACIFTQNYYVALVPGVGGCISVYTLYLAQQYPHLKSFSKNNNRFAQENERLETQVGQLQDIQKELQQTGKALNKTKHTLKQQVTHLKDENYELQRSITKLTTKLETLKQTSEELTREVEDLGEKNETLESLIKNLSQLNTSLSSTVKAVKEDHASFGASVSSIANTDASMQDNLAVLNETTRLLGDLFTQISEWKDEEVVNERLERAQQLQAEIAKHEFALKELVTQLDEVKQGLAQERAAFAEQNRTLKREVKKLSAQQKPHETQ